MVNKNSHNRHNIVVQLSYKKIKNYKSQQNILVIVFKLKLEYFLLCDL